jgi:riboflavin synthase
VFTGLIETVGRVTGRRPARDGLRLEVRADRELRQLQLGESIAVDGVCLTVTEHHDDRRFSVDVSSESVSHSIVGGYSVGTRVNLERALRLSDRLGGHLVSGHVDGTGTLRSRRAAGESTRFEFAWDPGSCALLVPKGSVAVNGVSLTLNELHADGFGVNVIPHTSVETNLDTLAVGDPVNLELDMLVKIVQRLMGAPTDAPATAEKGDISLDLLARSGFIKAPSGTRGGRGRR